MTQQPSRIVQENVDALIERERAGRIEHGDDMDRTDFPVEAWLAELISESLDSANYGRKLQHMLPKLVAAAKRLEGMGFAWADGSWQATCTCPSGDGSLRWPCPVHTAGVHGAVAKVGSDHFRSIVDWLGPIPPPNTLLYAAPVTASPADHLHAHLLHMLGAKDHEDACRIIGELHAATMRTPAAPGIDMGVPGATLTIDGKTFTVDEVRAALDAQPSPVVKQNLTTAAAQEAVAWVKTKPASEGDYYVRGFNLFAPKQYEALVQVRMHHFVGEPAPELVCNLHESTSSDDMDDWSPIVEMSDDFEWMGPLFAAPVTAAPAGGRDVRSAIAGLEGSVAVGSDGEWVSVRRAARDAAVMALRNVSLDCAHIYAAYSEAKASTPAAPGIDLSEHHVAVLRDMREHMANRTMSLNDWDKLGTAAIDAVLALIDASRKGGDAQDAARYRWLREHFRFANDSLRELWFDPAIDPNDGGVPEDLDQEIDRTMSNAHSAEVGS